MRNRVGKITKTVRGQDDYRTPRDQAIMARWGFLESNIDRPKKKRKQPGHGGENQQQLS